MDKIKNKIINYLTNGQGFIVESFKVNDVNNEYVLVKEFPQGNVAILIVDSEIEISETNECINFLKSKNRNFNLYKIVLTGSNYVNNIDGTYKIIINKNTNEIIYYDNESSNLANNIRNIISKPRNGNMFNKRYGTISLIIIGINILMYIISGLISGNFIDIDAHTLYILGGKYGPAIDILNQWWRLITCMFLHGGILHLFCNMYSLYIIGPQVEAFFGKVKFIIIYLGSGIGASYLSYKLDPDTLSIGASGAIFGLFGALLVYLLKERERFTKESINNIVIIITLNLVIGFSSSNIDNYGHIGGLILGIILSLVFMVTNEYKFTKEK